MIPATNGFLTEDFKIMEESSRTFYLDIDRNTIAGYTDSLEAMKQAIYLILSTERYKHVIFSWNYGIELFGLFGEPMTFVVPELERRITEALMQDSRIKSLENFDFIIGKCSVYITFTAVTVFGDVSITHEVIVNE